MNKKLLYHTTYFLNINFILLITNKIIQKINNILFSL